MSLTVSVIIPTYNRPRDLQRALSSVLAQDCPAREIIIVNDGDLDLPDKLNIRLTEHIQLVHTGGRRGANFARNRGAELAISEILMFLDDDDTWQPDKIEKQLAIFQKYPDVGLVYSGKNIVFDTDPGKTHSQISVKLSGERYGEILERNFIGTTSSVAVRAGIFKAAGGFDEALPAMQDYDLWIRICKLTKVAADEAHLVNYTVNKSGKKQISNSGDAQLRAANIILNKYSSEYAAHGISLRKRMGRFYFYVAKSKRKTGLLPSLKWILKSFWLFPSARTLFLLFSSERI